MERRSYEGPTSAAPSTPISSGRKPPSDFFSKSANGLQSPIESPSQQRHQRFVLSDPVAFSYLEEDRHAIVLDRSRQLEGYQAYVVEQWACSRSHPTFVIIAYTGDSSHTIKVGVLSVPADEDSWSPRMRVYFKSLAQYHARRKDTPLGTLMVTNLSTFPSSLTIVHIPDGDLRKHREAFFVAENLKRFGCSGRVGLSIAVPSGATQAKFHQLYKISEKINLNSSVIELVKLCQVSLNLFGCIGPEYADGLLCDITEAAISEWWTQLGADLYNVEPNDGVLGPTTVAALLGTLMGARNRLSVYGAPVAKDVFDIESTKRAVAYFQKTQHIRKTRRLDRVTLYQLHKATAKQASGEGGGWGVPRAVKSTVAELSGKGGEMVMDIVGRADKANISEIETVDIERFAQLVKGERAQWLWHGKARKRTTRDIFNDIAEEPHVPKTRHSGEHSTKNAPTRTPKPDTLSEPRNSLLAGSTLLEPIPSSIDGHRPDIGSKQGTFRRAKGRLKGVVGMRANHQDGLKRTASSVMLNPSNDHSAESLEQPGTGAQTPASLRRSIEINDEHQSIEPEERDPKSAIPRVTTGSPMEPGSGISKVRENGDTQDGLFGKPIHLHPPMPRTATTATTATQLSEALTAAFEAVTANDDLPANDVGPLLRRTHSLFTPGFDRYKVHNDNWWPRALSFSAAVDSVLPSSQLTQDPPSPTPQQQQTPPGIPQQQRQKLLRAALARELQAADAASRLRASIAHLSTATAEHVAAAIGEVEDLDVMAAQDAEQLNHLYYPRKDEFASLQEGSRELVTEGRGRLQEALREVEVLQQKLEYEIGALKGKVEDVEGAVDEFERQVRFAEGRVRELVSGENRDGWFTWAARSLFGLRSSGDVGIARNAPAPPAAGNPATGADAERENDTQGSRGIAREIAAGATPSVQQHID